MPAIRFSFANAELTEDDALVLADLLAMQRSTAAHDAGSKLRKGAERLPDPSETSELVELEPDERAALLDLLDALPAEEIDESWRKGWRSLRDEMRGSDQR
jgi:hypothetical protein